MRERMFDMSKSIAMVLAFGFIAVILISGFLAGLFLPPETLLAEFTPDVPVRVIAAVAILLAGIALFALFAGPFAAWYAGIAGATAGLAGIATEFAIWFTRIAGIDAATIGIAGITLLATCIAARVAILATNEAINHRCARKG